MNKTNSALKKYGDSSPFYVKMRTSASVLALLAVGALPVYAQEDDSEGEMFEEEVVVTGLRGSIITAQEMKRESTTIVDSIAADDIGVLPDRSVTELLSRVPGVAIDRYMTQGDPEHFSVEGNGVIVRGLTQVRSELNGRSAFSADGGRTLSFGDVPPELLGAVNVHKSPQADQIEGGLAGTIDLRTKLPFDNDGQQISATVGMNYGNLVEETSPTYSGLYSNVWDTDIGKLGLLVDFAYSELSTRNDSMYVRPFFKRSDLSGQDESRYLTRGADWRTMFFNRARMGSYLAAQWSPTEEQEFTYTYFGSNYDMNWSEDAIFVENWVPALDLDTGIPAEFNEDGRFVSGRLVPGVDGDGNAMVDALKMGSDIRMSDQESKTSDQTLQYKFTGEKFEIEAGHQKVQATSAGLDSTVSVQTRVPYIDIDLSGDLPKIGSDDAFLGDHENYFWGFLMDNQYNNKGKMDSTNIDVKYHFENDIFKALKVGARVSRSESNNFDTGYNWGAIGHWAYPWAMESGGEPELSMLTLNSFDNFFRGDVPTPPSIYAPAEHWAAGHPESYDQLLDTVDYYDWFNGHWQPRDLTDQQWFNSQKEKTKAAYVMLDFGFDNLPVPISGNLGVRYVETDNSAYGYLNFPNQPMLGLNGEFEESTAKHSYSNVLPSLNIKADLTDDLVLRFAVAETMTRPDFDTLRSGLKLNADIDLTPYLIANPDDPDGDPILDPNADIGVDDFDFSGGSNYNPYMDPMQSTQLDTSLEWYYAEGNSLSLALFHKDIDGYPAKEFVLESYAPKNDGPEYQYLIERPVTSGTAKISGFEVALTHFFTTLPSPFDGFGVQANYTYIDSETDLENDADPVDTDGNTSFGVSPYQGLSKHAYNLVGIYEKGRFSARLAYNWRNRYLTDIGANGFNGEEYIDADGNVIRDGSPDPKNAWKLPTYNAAAGYLDASLFYRLTDNLHVSLQANNLGNTATKTIVDQASSGEFFGAYHVNDTRYQLQLTAKY